MDDMKQVIVPKSDQLNADDLLAGPITVKISGVSIRPGTEQPISVSYEGDKGKPWKPCKSMARVMVSAWGPDSSKYAGRSLTLYCDPKVKWGGMEVGGIRISHMSDIDSALTMALTMTRANKKPYTVRPLKSQSGDGAEKGTVAPDARKPLDDQPPSLGAPDAAAPTITTEQIQEIETRLEMKGINKQRFLMTAKVASVDKISPERFAGVIKWIDAQK